MSSKAGSGKKIPESSKEDGSETLEVDVLKLKLNIGAVTWGDHGRGPSCPAVARCSDQPRPPQPAQSILSPKISATIYRYLHPPN